MSGRSYLSKNEVADYQSRLKKLAKAFQSKSHIDQSAAFEYLASNLTEKTTPAHWQTLCKEVQSLLNTLKKDMPRGLALIKEIQNVLEDKSENPELNKTTSHLSKELLIQKLHCQAIRNRHNRNKLNPNDMISICHYFESHMDANLTREKWLTHFNEIKHLFTKNDKFLLDKNNLLRIAKRVFEAIPAANKSKEALQRQSDKFDDQLNKIRKTLQTIGKPIVHQYRNKRNSTPSSNEKMRFDQPIKKVFR